MKDALARHIGQRLRRRRRLLDLTQGMLGEACGCSFQTIHKYETGSVQIPAVALFALSEALNVSTNYVFEGFESRRVESARDHSQGGVAAP